MSLAQQIKKHGATTTTTKLKARSEPVWAGPESAADNGGITFSLLSRFLVCRERFRLLVVEGLRPVEAFNARIEFGNMWHVCEEALAGGDLSGRSTDGKTISADGGGNWLVFLQKYCRGLCTKFKTQQQEINDWYEKCKALFPIYMEHWAKHPDVKNRTPLLQEQPFHVAYKLPSGREVYLRGKWDSVDLIEEGKSKGVYIQENKTKSIIDKVKIARQCSFDLQTMIYLIALQESSTSELAKKGWANQTFRKGLQDLPLHGMPIRGVRYNVIRRSAHKGSKNGSKSAVDSMLEKFHADKKAGRIEEWLARWKIEVTEADIKRFKQQCLYPILEQLCDWWSWISGGPRDCKGASVFDCCNLNKDVTVHWRHPFGVYNVLDEGGSSDLDSYLETGREAGLQRTEELFPELKQG